MRSTRQSERHRDGRGSAAIAHGVVRTETIICTAPPRCQAARGPAVNTTADTSGTNAMTMPDNTWRLRVVMKIVALVVAACGLHLVCETALVLSEPASGDGYEWPALLILSPHLLAMAGLGVFCLYAAYRSLRRLSPRSLRLLWGAATINLCGAALCLPETLLPADTSERAGGIVFTASALLMFPIGFVIYRYGYRWLARRLSPAGDNAVLLPGVPRWVVGLAALLALAVADGLTDWLVPSVRDLPPREIPALLRIGLGLAHLLVVMAVYLFGARLLCRPN